jgi:hypothetical protein
LADSAVQGSNATLRFYQSAVSAATVERPILEGGVDKKVFPVVLSTTTRQ